MKYYKTVDENGNLIRLDKSTTQASGIEISEIEYNLLYAAINIEINGIPVSELAKGVHK
ncbi:MAG: hypothetical protein U0M60_01645 [Clostridia bacterium]|nr:hypothetical protein [Clostridia bacterium]